MNSIFNKNYRNSAGNLIYGSQQGSFFVLKTNLHFPYGYLNDSSCWRYIGQPFIFRVINRLLSCFGAGPVIIRRFLDKKIDR